MQIIDLHCDHLYKLQMQQLDLELDTSLERLRQGRICLQAFAIFVDPQIPANQAFAMAEKQIELFHSNVINQPGIRWIRTWNELHQLTDSEIGVFLTLEGVDCIGNEVAKLEKLLDAGVLSVGLTWNPANLAADGCGEPRAAGLSTFGKQIVTLLNRRGILTDTAHLSQAGFWDVMELADFPIVSHANARAICDHPRNLTDQQIRLLIEKQIPLHVVFFPPFITGTNHATIDDLVDHIRHIVKLGGESILAFGSDFDGIDKKVEGLEHAGMYNNLIDRLREEYTEEQVTRFTSGNFTAYIDRMLKKETEDQE
ncbi:dipeptidase [Chryseomicrobium sp. FSL W7-1435]|uniref:dipeptidase n=1 Tax=Chryseomicrobium sp. FSL W7-1435 TaxID=2921704 RepID=UPI00315AEA8E